MSATRLPARLATAGLARRSPAAAARLPTVAAFSTTPPALDAAPPSRPAPKAVPTGLPGANLPGKGKYSPTTVKIVTSLAKLFGYNSQTSTAIRTASDYYDKCAERAELEAPFFYEECQLPPSFQTWFSITTLHIWLLQVRFRSLPDPLGRTYVQELINHFFIDLELRIRGPYAVTQSRLIKGYMKDLLEQYHGSCAAYDEGLIAGDAALAAAIWRNLFGAGWGGVAGVKGKRAPKAGEVPALGPNKEVDPFAVDPVQQKLLKKGQKSEDLFTTDQPIVDPKVAAVLAGARYPEDPELEFAQSLERIVVFVRREVARLEGLSEEAVVHGRPATGPGSLTDFTPISPQ